jgi:hypothetical protein
MHVRSQPALPHVTTAFGAPSQALLQTPQCNGSASSRTHAPAQGE